MKRTIAIGDIHGCFNTLMMLWNELNIDICRDKIIFLGDYIDRGNYSLDVLKFVYKLHKENPDSVITLMGNHEDMAVKYYLRKDSIWRINGYKKTKEELNCLSHADKKNYLDWMSHLPWKYETDTLRFCHSGYWGTGYYYNGRSHLPYTLWDRE